MKQILFLLGLTVFVLNSNAQTLDFQNGKLEYSEVIDLPNKTLGVLKKDAEQWAKNYFNSEVFKINDSDKIVIEGSYKTKVKYLYTKIPEEIFYDLTINLKEGKYQYKISNFRLVSQGIQTFDFYDRYKSQGKINKKIYSQATNEAIQSLINSLQNDLKKENW